MSPMDTDHVTDIRPDRPTRFRAGPVSADLVDLPLLQALVRKRDITLTELATEVGCSASYAQNIHGGFQRRISQRLATRLENALGAPGQLFVPVVDTDHVSETRPNRAQAAS